MKHRPITVIGGRLCAIRDIKPNSKLYRFDRLSYQGPVYVPLKDTDTHISCFYNGRIKDFPRDQVLGV